MKNSRQSFAGQFVASTRRYLFVRPADGVLILRPNKVHHLNETAAAMLHALYTSQVVDVAAVVSQIAAHYNVEPARVEANLAVLLRSLSVLLSNQPGCAPAVKPTPFGSHQRQFPVLAEIALMYRCQNRCAFCYASAPERGRKVPTMSTAEVKTVIGKIVDQAHVPGLSFTGGKPTSPRPFDRLFAAPGPNLWRPWRKPDWIARRSAWKPAMRPRMIWSWGGPAHSSAPCGAFAI